MGGLHSRSIQRWWFPYTDWLLVGMEFSGTLHPKLALVNTLFREVVQDLVNKTHTFLFCFYTVCAYLVWNSFSSLFTKIVDILCCLQGHDYSYIYITHLVDSPGKKLLAEHPELGRCTYAKQTFTCIWAHIRVTPF